MLFAQCSAGLPGKSLPEEEHDESCQHGQFPDLNPKGSMYPYSRYLGLKVPI